MLKFRLQRIGRKRYPFYRIVVIKDKTSPTGRAISVIGYYNSITKELVINSEKLVEWLLVGVQPTKTVSCVLKIFFKKNLS